MGNICSKSANKPDDAFSQPGRVLGSSAASGTPSQPARASVPGNVVSQGPGRTLGGPSSSQDTADARGKAAEAAQVYTLHHTNQYSRCILTCNYRNAQRR